MAKGKRYLRGLASTRWGLDDQRRMLGQRGADRGKDVGDWESSHASKFSANAGRR